MNNDNKHDQHSCIQHSIVDHINRDDDTFKLSLGGSFLIGFLLSIFICYMLATTYESAAIQLIASEPVHNEAICLESQQQMMKRGEIFLNESMRKQHNEMQALSVSEDMIFYRVGKMDGQAGTNSLIPLINSEYTIQQKFIVYGQTALDNTEFEQLLNSHALLQEDK